MTEGVLSQVQVAECYLAKSSQRESVKL